MVNRVYKAAECKFGVGEPVKVKEAIYGGYDKDLLYAEAGDTGVVVRVPRSTRPMVCVVLMDNPRLRDRQLCITEDNLEAL